MTDHEVVDRQAWQAAREELLQREKKHTRQADELARQRRDLPWVAVEKEYSFDADDGHGFAGDCDVAVAPERPSDHLATALEKLGGVVTGERAELEVEHDVPCLSVQARRVDQANQVGAERQGRDDGHDGEGGPAQGASYRYGGPPSAWFQSQTNPDSCTGGGAGAGDRFGHARRLVDAGELDGALHAGAGAGQPPRRPRHPEEEHGDDGGYADREDNPVRRQTGTRLGQTGGTDWHEGG